MSDGVHPDHSYFATAASEELDSAKNWMFRLEAAPVVQVPMAPSAQEPHSESETYEVGTRSVHALLLPLEGVQEVVCHRNQVPLMPLKELENAGLTWVRKDHQTHHLTLECVAVLHLA